MWSRSKSLMLSRVMVYIFYAVLIVLCGSLPWLLRWYMDSLGKQESLFLPLMSGLYLSALAAFVALFCLDRLLLNMRQGHVFTSQNVKLLRFLSWSCYVVSLLFFAFCVYYVAGAIIALLAAFAGLIVRVVKNVFAEALELKQENDLTV